VGQPILIGFSVALAGLVIGLFIGWIINAYCGTTAVVPGKLGMIVAGVFGIALTGSLFASAWRTDILFPMLLGTTSGILIPVIVGNILRLHFIERMGDDTGMHSWKWGRLFVGCFLLLVTMGAIADAPDFPPAATYAEIIDPMIGRIAAWALFAGAGLWLIRDGTRRPGRDADFPGR
jgi:hypothetical protein